MKNILKRTMAVVTGAAAVAFATPGKAKAATTITTPTGFFTDFGTFISSLLNLVMVIAALLVFVYLIWGGIDWITAGTDKGKTDGARTKITNAVIGLIVLAASYAILTLVLNFLNYDDLNDVINTNL